HPALPPHRLDTWADIAKLGNTGLLNALGKEDFHHRLIAQRELVKRGPKNRDALLKIVKKGPVLARVAALGALQSLWSKEVAEAFVELLQDDDPEIRRLAADGLALNSKAGDREIHEALVQVQNDEDPLVRRTIALAIARVNAPGAEDILVNALQFDKGK